MEIIIKQQNYKVASSILRFRLNCSELEKKKIQEAKKIKIEK